MAFTPRVEIRYCHQCKWEARAAWMAQEILSTFAERVGEVVLVPDTGGTFTIRAGEKQIWSRAERDRFPQPKELKQAVRDVIAPDDDLGHADAH